MFIYLKFRENKTIDVKEGKNKEIEIKSTDRQRET